MKLCVVKTPEIGLSETFIRVQIEGLPAEVSVIHGNPPRLEKEGAEPWTPSAPVRIYQRVRHRFNKAPKIWDRQAAEYAYLLKESGAEVVLAHSPDRRPTRQRAGAGASSSAARMAMPGSPVARSSSTRTVVPRPTAVAPSAARIRRKSTAPARTRLAGRPRMWSRQVLHDVARSAWRMQSASSIP